MTSRFELFDQTLNASLLQPLSSTQPDFKAYKTRVKLKILEKRNEATGEKELKFELSRADDYEFLFAETLNNEKYQTLAREHDLTVDFDTFPKVIIQHLLSNNIVRNAEDDGESDARKKPGYHSIIAHGKPTEINITLDADKNFCLFELFSKTPISKGRIFSMKLGAVRGDHLISHLLKICSSQAAKLSGYHKISDDLSALKIKYGELEEQNSKLEEYKEKFEEDAEKMRELEDELELVKEEKENIRVLAEDKDVMIADLEADVKDLQNESEEIKVELDVVVKMLEEEREKVDQMKKRGNLHQKELSRLRAEMESIQRKLDKSQKDLARNDSQQNQQSVDVRKLRELEADLKEKDTMVDSLTETIGALRKELEDEKLKTQEVMDSFEKLKVENEAINQRLQMYRTQRFGSTPPVVGTVPTPFKKVLGPDSPYNNNSTMKIPFRNATNSTFSHTPNTNRFTSHLAADDTTGSTLTQTPPVLRNLQ
ncbi:CBN-SAS-6 protein [Caenorhabditis brenneri]|uniref:CBN-SAS-6 protein n=1 Tax=Caenorhabditis brenneri TaxID=135651 RepID=G0N6C0_CAEBE|nr:CBN-SAS-6 protein [Caenorhabditis brenneri]